jgi:hypothetical protein
MSYGCSVEERVHVISFVPKRKALRSVVPIFTKLTNVQQHYVQILKFHQNRAINVEIVGQKVTYAFQ